MWTQGIVARRHRDGQLRALGIGFMALVLWTTPRSALSSDVEYWWSEGGEFGVRVIFGFDRRSVRQAFLLRHDEASGTYLYVETLALPTRFPPEEMVISEDGRYVVALGRCMNGQRALSDAVWLLDRRENETKVFGLADFLTRDEIRRYVDGIPMYPGVEWFERSSGPFGPWLDPRTSRLIVTPKIAGVTLNHRAVTDNRSAGDWSSVVSRPMIVLDLNAREIRMVRSDAKDVWKSRYEQSVMRECLLAEVVRRVYRRNGEQFTLLIRELAKPAQIEFWHDRSMPRWMGGERFLCRLSPRTGRRPAEVTIFEFSDDDRVCRKVRTVPLVNPVAPVIWRVVGQRYVVTLDDIGRIGVTENAVVIYDIEGGRTKRFAVEDFLDSDEIARLPVSIEHFRSWRASSSGWHLASVPDGRQDGTSLKWVLRTSADVPKSVPHITVNIAEMKVELSRRLRPGDAQ